MIYSTLMLVAWLILAMWLWSVSSISWTAYDQLPLIQNLPGMQSNIGRHTMILGAFDYLQIDRDNVDLKGKTVAGAAESVKWRWSASGLAWSVVLTIIGAAAAIFAYRWLVNRGRLTGRCDECGYDLTGLVSAKCPECGMEVSADSRHYGSDR